MWVSSCSEAGIGLDYYNQICFLVFRKTLHSRQWLIEWFQWQRKFQQIKLVIITSIEVEWNHQVGGGCINILVCFLSIIVNYFPYSSAEKKKKKYFFERVLKNKTSKILSNNVSIKGTDFQRLLSLDANLHLKVFALSKVIWSIFLTVFGSFVYQLMSCESNY